MMKSLLAGVAVLAASTPAAAVMIDFETEATGNKPNGYTVEGVTFSDTAGSDLQVLTLTEGIGRSLVAASDLDNSAIRMDFDSISRDLSLTFGNDDPRFSGPGDEAYLEIYLGGSLIGVSVVVPNFDDLMNQTISALGQDFDSALFYYGSDQGVYTTAGGVNTGLTEVIDNITFNQASVPAPGALGLVGLGMLGLAARRRVA